MPTDPHPLIEIFTTPTCSDCLALKRWLQAQYLPFVERDLRDPAVAEEAMHRSGIRVAHVTIMGDSIVFGTFTEQLRKIEALLDSTSAA